MLDDNNYHDNIYIYVPWPLYNIYTWLDDINYHDQDKYNDHVYNKDCFVY